MGCFDKHTGMEAGFDKTSAGDILIGDIVADVDYKRIAEGESVTVKGIAFIVICGSRAKIFAVINCIRFDRYRENALRDGQRTIIKVDIIVFCNFVSIKIVDLGFYFIEFNGVSVWIWIVLDMATVRSIGVQI